MPLDPQTGKWQDVSLTTTTAPYSQGRNAEPNPAKELKSASRRLVAETQMAMRPSLNRDGTITATPGGKKSETARSADADTNAQKVFGKDNF